MKIPVVLKDGREQAVSKDLLQYLLVTKKIRCFKRSDGWVAFGPDKMRCECAPYLGMDRRGHRVFATYYWY